MNTPLATALVLISILAAIAIGLMLRNGGRREAVRRPARPPMPPTRTAPNPMLRSYEGAARLQRAGKAATQFLMQANGEIEETGTSTSGGYKNYGIRPTVPIDALDLATAIITAWLGDEEPVVHIPIMKLGQIKVDLDEDAEKAIGRGLSRRARLAAVNTEREAMGLPPLATGGYVEQGKVYIVGEQPTEKPRPTWPAPTPLHPRQDDEK